MKIAEEPKQVTKTEPAAKSSVHGTIGELARNDRIAEGERPYEITIEEVPYYAWGKSQQQAKARLIAHLRDEASVRLLTMADMFQALKDKGEEA